MSAALNDITVSAHAAVGYFVDQKKGEVNELKTLLKGVNSDRDLRRKREVIKKVIAYMTLGIDVSRLFTDMIMAIETKDIVIKKMVYFYLCNYAHSEPEMAIMCINSLRRDCDNENPLVRGLALRSLCSLRLESILEYVEQPLQKGLRDISAYVRKTAVLGVLKLHYLSPSLVEANHYVEQVETMLQDVDANVVTNAIYVLHELQLQKGGIPATQTIAMSLLNRIGEFSEWGLNTVLEIVARYRPSSEEEVFTIMNLLDPVLRTANSGSVLATLKCFFSLSSNLPELYPQIIARAKPPLLTLITGGNPEVQYMTLKHLENILHQPFCQNIFESEYRQFFVRYNEPPHVKHLKVDLLPPISCAANAREIAAELGEYVTDVDGELSKRAIKAIGEIAIRVPEVAEEMTNNLVQVMEMDSLYIRAQTSIVLADVVRVVPRLSDLILPHLAKYLRRAESSEAKASLVWMLGEFGHNVLEAPYILEQIIEGYNDESSVQIKLQLLTAAVKLFIQRPPEMQRMLGRLLVRSLNDTHNQDLHDRALLYYRMLSNDVNALASIVCAGPACSSVEQRFAEDKDLETKKTLFAEFNTLAIVFNTPSSQFIPEAFRRIPSEAEKAPLAFSYNQQPLLPDSSSATEDLSTHQHLEGISDAVAKAPLSAAPIVGSVNLLDWDDMQPASQPAQSVLVARSLNLCDYTIDIITPPIFQRMWSESKGVFSGQFGSLRQIPSDCSQLETQLFSQKVFTMASGMLSDRSGLKLFLYSLEKGSNCTILCQLQVSTVSGDILATVKCNDTAIGELFVSLLRQILLD